ILNNYVEAAGENIMFGGGDPSSTDVNIVPSDIDIEQNFVHKKPCWMPGDPTFGTDPNDASCGIAWQVKNLFELKNARRVLVQGNIFEYNWPSGQAGRAILFTVRNQDGRCTWCTVE